MNLKTRSFSTAKMPKNGSGLSHQIKKNFMFLLVIFSSWTAANAQTTTGTTSDGLIYTTGPGQVTITGYSGTGGAVNIPASIDGLPLTSIGDFAFQFCFAVTSVTVPNGVINIGNYAFNECQSLIDVSIPNSVTTIGNGAFSNCNRLNDLVIPDSVTTIGDIAFYRCSSLTTLLIPKSVTFIGKAALASCANLKSIEVDALNSGFTSVSGVLFNKPQTSLISYPTGKLGGYAIPDSVTEINAYAFNECSNLTGIIIPDSVTSIGSNAFAGCTGLTNVVIPKKLKTIKSYTFYLCSGIKTIIVPDSVITIEDSAFEYCFAMTDVVLGTRVISIGNTAFGSCTNLKFLIFLGNAPAPGSSVFQNTASNLMLYYFAGRTGFNSQKMEGHQLVTLGVISSEIANNGLNIKYYAGDLNVKCGVECSSDLKSWTISGITFSNPDAMNYQTATISLNSTAKFMRLIISY